MFKYFFYSVMLSHSEFIGKPAACFQRILPQSCHSTIEIKTICTCGKKAIVNARIDENGKIVTEGGQILLGGNDSYVAMCHSCWMATIEKQANGN